MKMQFYALVAGALFAVLPACAQYQLPPGTQMPPAAQAPATQGDAAASELDAAETQIAQGNYQAARAAVEKYLQAHPADARAHFDLGYVEQAQNQAAQAAVEYRKAIAADPKQFEARLALGLMLAQQGKDAEARRQLQQATQLTPATPDFAGQAQAFRALAELELATDPAQAKEALLSALKISPQTPRDLLLTAEIANAEGDSGTAETAYRRLLAGHPPAQLAVQASAGLSHLLLQQKHYAEAESVIRSALKQEPNDVSLNAQLATALIADGKNDQALPVLDTLRRLKPGDTAVDEMLADAYAEIGQPAKAEPLYAEMLQAQPANAAWLAGQGRNFILAHHFPQAQQALERAVRLNPTDGEAWAGLAFAATKNKQYPAALKALTMRAKYLPETPASYFLWAISYDNVHQVRLAQEYYRKFLASDQGKLRDEEWQAKQRLVILGRESR